MSTQAKRCKVKVTRDREATKVEILALNADGTDGRVQARAELNASSVYGAARYDVVDLAVSGPRRKANALSISAETETTTDQYYARNVQVVRFADQPSSVEAGKTAIYVGANYCQRLSPAIPAW